MATIANNLTPPLVMQGQLCQWLNAYINNYTLTVDETFMNLIQNNPSVPEAVAIFGAHALIGITADGTPLTPAPDVGQRGSIRAYTMVSGGVMTITGICSTFQLWLRGENVTPLDNTWDGTFEETVPGVYVLEGRQGVASGFIVIEVTD